MGAIITLNHEKIFDRDRLRSINCMKRGEKYGSVENKENCEFDWIQWKSEIMQV